MATLAHNTQNDTRLKDMLARVRKLGEDAGKGKDAREKLALELVRGAQDGFVGEDDLENVLTEYIDAESKKAIHNHKADSLKVLKSKCNALLKAAALYKGDNSPVNFAHTLDKLVQTIRPDLRKAEKKLKPAFESYVAIAREQCKPEYIAADLPDDVLIAMSEQTTKEDSILDKLVADYKRMEKRHEELPSPSIEACIAAIKDAMREVNGGELPPLTKEEKKEHEAIAFLASRGRIAA